MNDAQLIQLGIPKAVRDRLLGGLENISMLRDQIGRDAPVRPMPPVQVLPAIFVREPDVFVHGATTILPATNQLGVMLAAGPLLCKDLALVRSLLVHEFAHCFMVATLMIRHIDAGKVGGLDLTTDDPMDEARENALLANPADWFGEADRELLRWGDPRIGESINDDLNALAAVLPILPPPQRVQARGVLVPPSWAAHVRKIGRTLS